MLFAGILLIAFLIPSWAIAQSTDDSWTEPINLSHSGIALNPSFVMDSDGLGHVVWQDNLANYVYTRFDGDQWSAPALTDLDRLFGLPTSSEPTGRDLTPVLYTGPNPLFMAGPDRYIYAFWLTPQGRLFTSRVRNINFERFKSWEATGVVAHEAASFAVAVDSRGEWQLAFLRTAEDPRNPAGIYYTHSRGCGLNWSVPVLLYESPYLRTLAEGEANLSVATAGTEGATRIYVAWDNRPRKQVLLVQSADGGKSWNEPAIVASAAPDSGLDGPFNIHVDADQSNVVLVWQSGQPTNGLLPGCSQIYQSSHDAGVTWNDPQPMMEDLGGCARSNEFVTRLPNSPPGPLYFLVETKSQVLLTAWNGLQWSEPEEQAILSGFEEPEIYTDVIFGCHQASMSGEKLYVVGCDQGQGGDAWVTARDAGADSSLFKLPAWSQLSPVTSEDLKPEAVELMATDDGLIHAFFSQDHDPAIYYTHWDGTSWSRINPVLEFPDGQAGQPAIAAGPGNELFLIAPNNQGMLYFSRATSGDASAESGWSTPARLTTGHDGEIGSVDVAWDTAGSVYVVYSVPVNEERGIYLVQSKDGGSTWSEPLQVFNGAAAGFDFVGAPSLLISENGSLHIVWKQQSIQGDGSPQPLSLYYTRSEDGGHTFDIAGPVVDQPVAWREMVNDANGDLHLLWQPQDTMTTVWDQISLDGGRSWGFPQALANEGPNAAVVVDTAGRLHLVDAGPGTLGHWLWDGSHWQAEAPVHWSLVSQQDTPVELFAAAVNKEGKMVVALSVPTGEVDTPESTLLYSVRTLALPAKQTTTKVPTQTLLPPTLIPATPTLDHSLIPVSTANIVSTNTPDQTDSSETDGPISPFVMALLPVALLLLSVLGIAIRRANQFKSQ